MVHQDEGFPALGAAVGPLPAVRALVDSQAALLREPLPALSASVRLLTRVGPVMYAEMGRTLETFPAHCAPESPLSFVALLVQLELVEAGERLSTMRANVASCSTGERFVGVVRVVAALCESVVRVRYDLSICGRSLPLRMIFRLPQMCNMRGVSLGVILLLLSVLLRKSNLRSELKIGRLRILLIVTVVYPVTLPLRGRLLDVS